MEGLSLDSFLSLFLERNQKRVVVSVLPGKRQTGMKWMEVDGFFNLPTAEGGRVCLSVFE